MITKSSLQTKSITISFTFVNCVIGLLSFFLNWAFSSFNRSPSIFLPKLDRLLDVVELFPSFLPLQEFIRLRFPLLSKGSFCYYLWTDFEVVFWHNSYKSRDISNGCVERVFVNISIADSTSSAMNTRFLGFYLIWHLTLKLFIYCMNILGLTQSKLIIINMSLSFLCVMYLSKGLGKSSSEYTARIFS